MSDISRYRIELEFRALEEEDMPEGIVGKAIDQIVEIANAQACDVDVTVERLSPVPESQIV